MSKQISLLVIFALLVFLPAFSQADCGGEYVEKWASHRHGDKYYLGRPSPNCPYLQRGGAVQTSGYLPSATVSPKVLVDVILPEDGRKVLYGKQVVVDLFNWAPTYSGLYGVDIRRPNFPASNHVITQSAQVRLGPQSAWESFNMSHQDEFEVRNLDNTVYEQNGGRSLYYDMIYSPRAVLNFPIPQVDSDQILYVTIRVKPDEVQDGIRQGISLKRHIIARLVEIPGIYIMIRGANAEWQAVALSALLAGSDIRAYRRLEQITSAKFGVTIQYLNAKTGTNVTFKKVMLEAFPIFQSNFVLFYDNVTGAEVWKSWDDEVTRVMREVRAEFVNWLESRPTPTEEALSKVLANTKYKEREVKAQEKLREATIKNLELTDELDKERIQKPKPQ